MSETAIGKLQKATKIILIAAVIAVLVASGTYLYGGTDAMKGVLLDSGIITDPKIKMIIGICMDVATFAVQICVMIAMFFIPGSQPAMVAALVAKFTEFTAKVAKTTVEVVKMVMQIVRLLAEAAIATTMVMANVASAGNQLALAKIKMELNKSLGDLESDIQLREMIIALLKKLLESIQSMIGNASAQIQTAMQGLESMWSDASGAINNLTSAA